MSSVKSFNIHIELQFWYTPGTAGTLESRVQTLVALAWQSGAGVQRIDLEGPPAEDMCNSGKNQRVIPAHIKQRILVDEVGRPGAVPGS